MKAGRVGDEATRPDDVKVCPRCKSVTSGPSKEGSADVYVNGQPALRMGDKGQFAEGGVCCGKNTWRATTGSSTVTVNGMPLHRVGDEIASGGKVGRLATGSSDVEVGSGGFGARSPEATTSLDLTVTDAFGRSLKGVKARVLSPDGVTDVKFDGSTKLSGLHKGSTVVVEKALQRSKADPGAVKGVVPPGTRMVMRTAAKKTAAKKTPNTGGAQAPDPKTADVPASNGTSTGRGGTSIPGSDGTPVDIVHLTVYNWVEAIYKAFKVKFPKDSWKIAMLGVREASMLTGAAPSEDAVANAERLAAQGKTSAEGGSGTVKQSRVKRRQDVDSPVTKYDDTLYIVWTESEASKKQKVEVFECTIDPQGVENPRGQPYLLEGFTYNVKHTLHRLDTYGSGAHAFRITDPGKVTITVLRTREKRFVDSSDDLGGIYGDEASAINMHFGSRYSSGVGEEVGLWSTGCTVLRHGLASKRYQRFAYITLTSHDPGVYLVVSAKYVRLFHEWVAYCDGDRKKAKDPKSVLKMGPLKNRALNGKYIPSLLDVDYAKANPSTVARALFTIME
jgi:uncharacterized Zn-binding protein involved in type VI secretion